MKKLVSIIFLAVSVQGCALHSIIPSFWDDNQSAAMIDVRQSINQLNCSEPQAPQVKRIKDKIEWFDLYSESKGMQQNDVRALTKPMQETVDDFYKRSVDKEGSKAYCEAKKKILQTQASKAAEGVLGRW
jgi:PBP1b-binding outer membrane lipoprotein LpoB